MKVLFIFLVWSLALLSVPALAENELFEVETEVTRSEPQKVITEFLQIDVNEWQHLSIETLVKVSYASAVLAEIALTEQLFEHISSRENLPRESIWWGKANFNLGFAYFKAGNYYQALDNYSEALSIFQNLNDEIQVARTKGVIALLENYSGAPDSALTLLNEVIGVYEKYQEWQKLTSALHNKAVIQIQLQQFNEAESHLMKALEMANRYDRESIIPYIYKNLGIAAAGKNNTEVAESYFRQSLEMVTKIPLSHEIAQIQLELAKIELSRLNLKTARLLIEEALDISTSKNYAMLKVDLLKLKSLLYEQENDFEAAYSAIKQANKLGDEIAGSELNKKLISITSHFATLKASHEKKLLENQNTIMQLHIENERQQRAMYATLSLLLLLIISIVILQLRKAKQRSQQYKMQSRYDGLTLLPNRTAFLESAAEFLDEKEPQICFALADIDKFKHINDSYGHECGDMVLKLVANKLKARCEQDIIAARWGGEEFVFALRNRNLSEASAWLDKLREIISSDQIDYFGNRFNVTLTFGVTSRRTNETVEEAIKRADALMYQGKQAGRNRVIS